MAGFLFFILMSCLPRASSAGEIRLTSTGTAQWQITAIGLVNIHALDLYLRFDPQRLPNLTVKTDNWVSGAMSAINNKTPGLIRLGVASVQPLPQSGILLKIQSSTPGAELVVSSFTAKTIDAEGKIVPTTVQQQLSILNPPATSTTEMVTPANPSQPQTVTTKRGGFVAGSVTFPNDSTPPVKERTTMPSATPADSRAKEAMAAGDSINNAAPAFSVPEKRFHSQEEIVTAIERLPTPWTVAAVKAIFLKPATASQVRQIPPVVLADGKSRVSLFLPKSFSQKTPTVGVQGCTLESIWDAKEQGWEIELVTSKGIWPAKALLLGEGDLIQFPVVIVPTINMTPSASDNDAIPSTDFDGNGSVNARDAYLYVGNVLAREVALQVK